MRTRAPGHRTRNVCRVYDIGEVDGQPFLSMEYVDGEDLASLLRRIGRLPADKAVEIARQLCAGLAAAHEQGVLHRDLKPANVMIDGRGRARITDFGLAGVAEDADGAGARGHARLHGARAARRAGRSPCASDIYSLGLVLYEMFTGQARRSRRERAEELEPLHSATRRACSTARRASIPPSSG